MASKEALNINKTNGIALISAIRCDRSEGNPQKGLERLAEWPTFSLPPDLIHEMAECYDAMGETTKAYHSFREANRRSSFDNLDVDRTLVTRYIEKMLVQHQAPEDEPFHPAPALHEPSPMFIVGFTCNGGDELGKMLNHHPSFGALGDLPAMDAARKALEGKDLGPLSQLSNDDIQRAREAYFSVSGRRVPSGHRVIDTSPLNVLSLPLVYRIFPDSCTIRMVRHPVETVFQAFRKLQRVNAISCHLDSMSRCAQLFLATNAMGNHYRDSLGIPMFDVAYEEFKGAPQKYGEGIVQSFGETWSPVPGFEPSTPLDQWHRYRSDLAPWTGELKKLATEMGYPAK